MVTVNGSAWHNDFVSRITVKILRLLEMVFSPGQCLVLVSYTTWQRRKVATNSFSL